jgi:hypothetical protein
MTAPDGAVLGTVCVLDVEPHRPEEWQLGAPQVLADQVLVPGRSDHTLLSTRFPPDAVGPPGGRRHRGAPT